MRRIILIGVIPIIIIAIIIIFLVKNNNIEKIGNTTYKIKNLKSYILNMNSYEAVADVTITSNKTTNKYKLKQKEINGKEFYQEVLEPEIISGSIFRYNNNNLILENAKLNISKIYENYQYISSNQLSLISFINDYKSSEDVSYSENETEVTMEVSTKNENKYIAKKTLRIEKNTGNPISLEVRDNTQNLLVYILYNEIKIKDEPEETIAFINKKTLIKI